MRPRITTHSVPHPYRYVPNGSIATISVSVFDLGHVCCGILELHAGVGNYSLPLALAGSIVFTAENMQRAVKLAQRNAERAGTTLHAHYLEDVDALAGEGPVPALSDFDAVLMNPPRIGAFEVAKILAESGPERLAYVSCDPATLARDVDALASGGYEITEVTAFDMFPQTPHVEVLLGMRRARRIESA